MVRNFGGTGDATQVRPPAKPTSRHQGDMARTIGPPAAKFPFFLEGEELEMWGHCSTEIDIAKKVRASGSALA